MFTLIISCLTMSNVPWSDIPGSCAVLFFKTPDFTYITRHIHNWVLFLHWPSRFILSGAISSCTPLFPIAYWTSSNLSSSSFSVTSFCLFIQFMEFSRLVYWSGLPFSPPVGRVFSKPSTMTCLSWVALHSMAHSFIELCKPFAMAKQWSMKGSYCTYTRQNWRNTNFWRLLICLTLIVVMVSQLCAYC